MLPKHYINAFCKNIHLLQIFFKEMSSDCIYGEYVIETLCRVFPASRCGKKLLQFIRLYGCQQQRKHWKYSAFVQDNPCSNCHSIISVSLFLSSSVLCLINFMDYSE